MKDSINISNNKNAEDRDCGGFKGLASSATESAKLLKSPKSMDAEPERQFLKAHYQIMDVQISTVGNVPVAIWSEFCACFQGSNLNAWRVRNYKSVSGAAEIRFLFVHLEKILFIYRTVYGVPSDMSALKGDLEALIVPLFEMEMCQVSFDHKRVEHFATQGWVAWYESKEGK